METMTMQPNALETIPPVPLAPEEQAVHDLESQLKELDDDITVREQDLETAQAQVREASRAGDDKRRAAAEKECRRLSEGLDKLNERRREMEARLQGAEIIAGRRLPAWLHITSRGAYFPVEKDGSLGPAHDKAGYQADVAAAVERYKGPGAVAFAESLKPLVVRDTKDDYATAKRVIRAQGAAQDYFMWSSYNPPTLQPVAGDWTPIYDILRNLCGNDVEHTEYVLDWLAHVIQAQRAGRPVRMLTALNFYGTPKGAGKNTMGSVIAALMGRSNVNVFEQTELDSQFNGWAAGKLFLIGNELFSSENRNKAATNKIKSLITDEVRWINEKNVKLYPVNPSDNVWFFSNDLRPLIIERDDRRLTCFRVAGSIPPALGKQVADDARAGGAIVAAFLEHLLARQPARVEPGDRPLETEARAEIMGASGNSAEKFAADILERGFHAVTAAWEERERKEHRRVYQMDASPEELEYFVQQEDGRRVPRSMMMPIYKAWCTANEVRPLSAENLYMTLRDAIPGVREAEKAVKYKGRTEKAFGALPDVGVGVLTSVAGGRSRKQGMHAVGVR